MFNLRLIFHTIIALLIAEFSLFLFIKIYFQFADITIVSLVISLSLGIIFAIAVGIRTFKYLRKMKFRLSDIKKFQMKKA
jgi:hypothetical protein